MHMSANEEWLHQFWLWCERLIQNDRNFREYAEIDFVSDNCVSLTFYSRHERFELTAAGPTRAIPNGVLELFMTDNYKPLRGEKYISHNDILGHLDGDFTEQTFDDFLHHLHERTPIFRRKFLKLSELDTLKRKQ